MQKTLSYPKILTSLMSAGPFTLLLCSARSGKTVLPCHVVSPPPRCSIQQAGDVEQKMKGVGAQACVNIRYGYRSDTLPLRNSPLPRAVPEACKIPCCFNIGKCRWELQSHSQLCSLHLKQFFIKNVH